MKNFELNPADTDRNQQFINEECKPLFDDDFWDDIFEARDEFWTNPDRCPF